MYPILPALHPWIFPAKRYSSTERQTDRHTDRQTDRHTHTHTPARELLTFLTFDVIHNTTQQISASARLPTSTSFIFNIYHEKRHGRLSKKGYSR